MPDGNSERNRGRGPRSREAPNFGQTMEISDDKLTDLLGSAGATIGIIIAGAIFLQFMSTKAIELTTHSRELTGDYRVVRAMLVGSPI